MTPVDSVRHALALGAARARGLGLRRSRDARGAGLSRPNVVGARAIGMGGAFTGIADDPTAVWYNPAGTAMYGDNVGYVGVELVIAAPQLHARRAEPARPGRHHQQDHREHGPDDHPGHRLLDALRLRQVAGHALRLLPPRLRRLRRHRSAINAARHQQDRSIRRHEAGRSASARRQILDFELTPDARLPGRATSSRSAPACASASTASRSTTPSRPSPPTLSARASASAASSASWSARTGWSRSGAVYRTPMSASISGNGPFTDRRRRRRRARLRPQHHLAAVGGARRHGVSAPPHLAHACRPTGPRGRRCRSSRRHRRPAAGQRDALHGYATRSMQVFRA